MRTSTICDEFLKPGDLAKILRVSDRTILEWIRLNIGPPFVRLSKRSIRFRPEDVEIWLKARSATQQ